ncbi:zinc finger MYM-type protein 1-like [Neodiprion virginianus]|uniref:zinc finger MYM-type protein 1-like n=1 Tax=Neodiprion virginianus TaxID=2961670 RepID=UPI001EE768B6|nr:zinc finger MYM-type protein 1-like [Neodiprion virginianus]
MSGAKRRKLTKEKEEKESLITQKIPRIDTFFINRETVQETAQTSSSATTEDSTGEQISRLQVESIVENEKEAEEEEIIDEVTNSVTSAAETRADGHDRDFSLTDPEGFNDWKNDVRIAEHERSLGHRENTQKHVLRGNLLGKIDSKLHVQYIQECNYWRQVLTRVIIAIKFLATRGLAFRETEEKFGSVSNGNYLGIREVMARNDPFLQNHIDRFGNPEKGNVSYFSKDICEEFIAMIYVDLLKKLISDVKASKYYAISVDSTPDISHSDQLTFIIRYVCKNGEPVERFLQFIPIEGHHASEIEQAIMQVLFNKDIDIKDCRGQSYDNASNMSGCYGGVQAKIIERNPLAIYVPCAAHSLNLVGQAAADCCSRATRFFMFVQHVYTFLSAATSRWGQIKSKVENQPGMLLPKSLSGTRWSARAEACRALVRSWESLRDALDDIAENGSEKPSTKAEAEGLSQQFGLLETAIMAVTWSDILERFEKTNKSLQRVNIDLTTLVQLYDALQAFVVGLRDRFDDYEEKAKELSQCNEYAHENQRRRRRTARFDEVSGNEAILDGKQNMRIKTFLVILDRLSSELEKRSLAYKNVNARFGFLSRLPSLTDAEIITQCEDLRTTYSTDLDNDFGEECIHFRNFIREIRLTEDEINIGKCLMIIREKNIVATFPNMDIVFRMYLTLFSSNATGERSFSTLKRVKYYLRNTMGQNRLSSLAFLSSNSELVDMAETDAIIDKFARLKARKRTF